jgi:hypothetical protein
MRAWRALRSAGAAVLRDGVYVLPDGASSQATLTAVADDVRAAGGSAHLIRGAGEAASISRRSSSGTTTMPRCSPTSKSCAPRSPRRTRPRA